jgi:putative PIN family toxin of toxin-antitoxin system
MRVVLDANVVIAAAASRGLCEAVFELCLERHHIVSCAGLLSEVGGKLSRKLRLPRAVVEEYVQLLRDHAEILSPDRVKVGLCRDPADGMVLGLVVPGRVDVIVSGDKDLLVLKKFETARIITPRDFWESSRDESA